MVVTYSDQAGSDVAVGKLKGGVAVLLGFKNGGKGTYAIEGNGAHLDLAVGATTKVSRNGPRSAR